jgi:hypothetical protein
LIDQETPYIQIGEAIENKWDTFDTSGKEVTEKIYVYSDYAGYQEGLAIFDKIVGLLDQQNLTVNNFNLVYFRFDTGSTALETFNQGKTRRISGDFGVIVQQI